jgi:hypothetical protein
MFISPFGVNTDISEDRSIAGRRWDSEVLGTHVFNCKTPVRLFGCILVLCLSTGIVDDFPVVSNTAITTTAEKEHGNPVYEI